MQFYVNQIFEETYPQEVALFCNASGYITVELPAVDGKRQFQIQEIPAPTQEEKEQQVRDVRNSYLEHFVDPKQLVLVWDSLTANEKQEYTDYRQYLLDYPESSPTWYEANPLTFAEWSIKTP